MRSNTMPTYSRVFVSLLIILIIILPAIYILGVLLPNMLYETFMLYFGEYFDFLTILSVIILIMSIVPPCNKKKIFCLTRNLKKILKKFFWPKNTEDVKFNDDIVSFAATEGTSNDFPLQNEINGVIIEPEIITTFNYLSEDSKFINFSDIFEKTRMASLKYPKSCFFSVLDLRNEIISYNKNKSELSLYHIWRGILDLFDLFLKSLFRQQVRLS